MTMYYESVFKALQENNVRYAVAGGVALVLHGVVRFTADLDLIVDLEPENLSRFVHTMSGLGYRPRNATFDAAFDAWYVYAYFYRADDPAAFAAVPFSEKGGFKAGQRQFDAQGLPLCAAGRAMPLQFTFTDRTSCRVEHERGKYVCPLRFPEKTADPCPAQHKTWLKGGCTAMMPTSIGARLRYTLDRESAAYKQVYNQRTAVERINSQAVALGIERPHLRNGAAIANLNTLIYLLINLRFLQRIRQKPPNNA